MKYLAFVTFLVSSTVVAADRIPVFVFTPTAAFVDQDQASRTKDVARLVKGLGKSKTLCPVATPEEARIVLEVGRMAPVEKADVLASTVNNLNQASGSLRPRVDETTMEQHRFITLRVGDYITELHERNDWLMHEIEQWVKKNQQALK